MLYEISNVRETAKCHFMGGIFIQKLTDGQLRETFRLDNVNIQLPKFNHLPRVSPTTSMKKFGCAKEIDVFIDHYQSQKWLTL